MSRVAPVLVATLLFAQSSSLHAATTRRNSHLRAAGREICIDAGDMCVPAGQKSTSPRVLAHKQELKLELSDNEACPQTLPGKAKLMVMPIVPMYHGSTALESIFMSNKNVTTLCSAGTWQCEARLDFDGIAHTICNLDSCVQLFERYVEYWDMDKPVLFEKGPRGMHEKVVREYTELQKERQEDPTFMQEHGIADLTYAYIMMWRPICMSLLSSHAKEDAKHNATQFALDELRWLEDLVASYKFLTDKGVHVLVTNLADMMWRAQESKQRLQSFVPCVGNLDFSYVPQLNKDIFPDNQWKAEGSVVEFGQSVDPEDCCGYSVETSQCSDSGAFFDVLDAETRKRADDTVEFLQSKSKLW